jgi:hypothetical protein
MHLMPENVSPKHQNEYDGLQTCVGSRMLTMKEPAQIAKVLSGHSHVPKGLVK